MNKIILSGRVGEEPSVHQFDNGNKVAKFSFATSEKYKKDGEKVEETEWWNIVTFNKAEVVEKYVHKGDPLLLEGKMKTRNYEDKDKNKKYITEAICFSLEMLGTKPAEKKEIGSDTKELDSPPDNDSPPPDDGIPF